MSSIWLNTVYQPLRSPSVSLTVVEKISEIQGEILCEDCLLIEYAKLKKINKVNLFSLLFPTKMLFLNIEYVSIGCFGGEKQCGFI